VYVATIPIATVIDLSIMFILLEGNLERESPVNSLWTLHCWEWCQIVCLFNTLRRIGLGCVVGLLWSGVRVDKADCHSDKHLGETL